MGEKLDLWEPKERCLGQIIRTQIKPEIIKGRGNCKICQYYLKNNSKCEAYESVGDKSKALIIFEVVDSEKSSG